MKVNQLEKGDKIVMVPFAGHYRVTDTAMADLGIIEIPVATVVGEDDEFLLIDSEPIEVRRISEERDADTKIAEIPPNQISAV